VRERSSLDGAMEQKKIKISKRQFGDSIIDFYYDTNTIINLQIVSVLF